MFQVWCHTLDGKVNSLLLLGPQSWKRSIPSKPWSLLSYMSRCYCTNWLTPFISPLWFVATHQICPLEMSWSCYMVPSWAMIILMMGIITPESTGRMTHWGLCFPTNSKHDSAGRAWKPSWFPIDTSEEMTKVYSKVITSRCWHQVRRC